MRAYGKAIVGALVAGLGTLQLALPDGITVYEWISVAVTTLVAFGAVWQVPNKPGTVDGPL